MTNEESVALLDDRWPDVEQVVRSYGGDPAADLVRDMAAENLKDRLVVFVRIRSEQWRTAEGQDRSDEYWFKLDFVGYDEHAPRIWVCDPKDRNSVGKGKEFYPTIKGNGVFSHDNFLCMPGDRRCYEAGNHHEWKNTQHYHPDIVIGSLFELIRSPQYQRRSA